jgi:streptomycin 3"-adenylyltransferase
MWVTVESGEIVPKDVAADRLLPRVERSGSRQVLQLARDAYRGDTWDDWTGREDEIGEFVDEATKTVRRSSGEG